jgi:hypothetical protein
MFDVTVNLLVCCQILSALAMLIIVGDSSSHGSLLNYAILVQ